MSDTFTTLIHPQEDDKTFITSYWTERTEDFLALRIKELNSEKHTLWQDELLKHLPCTSTPLRILDIGCGAGFFSIILSESGHDVTGIDMTDSMIEASRFLAESVKSDAVFYVMDAENLTFDENLFDVVIARNVTWNLPNPQKAYCEWIRVLKPEGILLNYDAEHAKDHHRLPTSVHNAHEHIGPDLLDKCHTMYHMLSISEYTRPQWDVEFLTSLSVSSVITDTDVGARIYGKEDEFYIPAPMFLIKAVK